VQATNLPSLLLPVRYSRMLEFPLCRGLDNFDRRKFFTPLVQQHVAFVSCLVGGRCKRAMHFYLQLFPYGSGSGSSRNNSGNNTECFAWLPIKKDEIGRCTDLQRLRLQAKQLPRPRSRHVQCVGQGNFAE